MEGPTETTQQYADRRRMKVNLRNYLLTATREECELEIQLAECNGDGLRVELINELIAEWDRNDSWGGSGLC